MVYAETLLMLVTFTEEKTYFEVLQDALHSLASDDIHHTEKHRRS